MMDPDIKDAWVAALRSDDYKQGHLRLETIDVVDGSSRFCCLGVLCDLAMKAGAEGVDRHVSEVTEGQAGRDFTYKLGVYNGEPGTLPDSVRKWSGLTEGIPNIITDDHDDGGGVTDLATLNDDYDYSFMTIANLIEDQL